MNITEYQVKTYVCDGGASKHDLAHLLDMMARWQCRPPTYYIVDLSSVPLLEEWPYRDLRRAFANAQRRGIGIHVVMSQTRIRVRLAHLLLGRRGISIYPNTQSAISAIEFQHANTRIQESTEARHTA